MEMKITKEIIRKMINEEIQRKLNENSLVLSKEQEEKIKKYFFRFIKMANEKDLRNALSIITTDSRNSLDIKSIIQIIFKVSPHLDLIDIIEV